jgi:hypothetical protein
VLVALLVAPLLAAGCARLLPLVPRLPRMTGQPRISEEELHQRLVDFVGVFAATVTAAADQIHDRTRDRAIRKRALLWKIRLIPVAQEAAFGEDVRQAYVSVLTLVVLLRQYLSEGDGRDVLGEFQPIGLAAARQLEDDARALGAEFLAPSELERVVQEVEAFARRRPILGREFDIQGLHLALSEVQRSAAFGWVLTLPMTPFRALEGVSSGAEAIHEFNQTAAEFSQIVSGLPQQVRWQSELLLYDIEDRETLVQGLAAFQSVAESAARATAAVEALPEHLRLALAESEGTLVRTNEVLASAQALVGPLNETAQHVQQAGVSWAEIFRRDGEPRTESRPFDVTEWESAAREIARAGARLAELTAELQGLVESQQLDAALDRVSTTVERAETSAQDVVDAAAWRGLQLIVAFFVLLLAYRLLSPLLPGARR